LIPMRVNARQFTRIFPPIIISTGALVLAMLILTLSPPAARGSNREVYPDPSQAKADIAAALKVAAQTHKRVLLDFGGDWCGDCQVLNIYFHDERNGPILNAGFVLVHVNIGHLDANLDIAQKFQVPVQRGVPLLAVLSENGTLLYAQKIGEGEAMSRTQSSAVTSFLVRWKPAKAGCSAVMLNC
jgi:thioredoxin 1